MTIARKNKKECAEKFILEGGQVRSDTQKETRKIKAVLMYIPMDVAEKIEVSRKQRIGITRHTWILEAIQEKLS